MTENMKKFLLTVSEDQELREKASKLEKEALIALAAELSIELTDNDFVRPCGEMSEAELVAVSGGGDCYCVAGGGGTKGANYPACACVLAGAGESERGGARCACCMAGSGAETWTQLKDAFTL